jgi:hypothetical protein
MYSKATLYTRISQRSGFLRSFQLFIHYYDPHVQRLHNLHLAKKIKNSEKIESSFLFCNNNP